MREKGFTIIEIIVYVGVLSIILTSIVSLLIWAVRSNTKIRTEREVLDNTRRALEFITYEVRASSGIYSPTTTISQLSLETKQSLPAGEGTTYIDFFLCGTRICLKRESQAPFSLSSDNIEVTNLSFIQVVTNERASLKVDLSTNYKNPDDRPDYKASIDLSSVISLRNY